MTWKLQKCNFSRDLASRSSRSAIKYSTRELDSAFRATMWLTQKEQVHLPEPFAEIVSVYVLELLGLQNVVCHRAAFSFAQLPAYDLAQNAKSLDILVFTLPVLLFDRFRQLRRLAVLSQTGKAK
eukprot:2430630-Rhodomonas_salina.1